VVFVFLFGCVFFAFFFLFVFAFLFLLFFVFLFCLRFIFFWVILERARSSYSEAKATVISDNGPQFHRTRLQKEFIRNLGHDARPNFALLSQSNSNGKIERGTSRKEGEVHPTGEHVSLDDARPPRAGLRRAYKTTSAVIQ